MVRLFLLGFLMLSQSVMAAFEPVGSKTISAVLADGSEIDIGEVKFSQSVSDQIQFELHLDHTKFTDFFLSMREFKCLPSEAEVSCHVPYPYKSPRVVTPSDYAWLSHRLLFLFKKPKEFGAKLWNGIYFNFKPAGDLLIGVPQAIDLNEIGAPPDNLTIPPYQEGNRHDMNVQERWIRELHIR